MPVFAQYDFNDAGSFAEDAALGNGAQIANYIDGATALGGEAVLDGQNDLIKILPDPVFQMDRGTLEINFATSTAPILSAQTLLSRDSVGVTEGGYHIDVMPDGSIQIVHESASGTQTFGTTAGFFNPGDQINLSYSWDAASGGQLVIENLTSATRFDAPVPAGLTMNMGAAVDQPWVIGAGQSASDPDLRNNIDQHFAGTVSSFTISDTVDNLPDPVTADGVVTGTAAGDLIDTAYLGDPDGDRIDANDALLPGDAPNDDRVEAGDGDDTVRAGVGDDSIVAGAGNDSVEAGIGDDTVLGGLGDDVLLGQDGSDLASGGDGNDMIDTSGSDPLPDRGYPGLYSDDANPTNDLDTVYGGAGNDTILTGDDADYIEGGAGDDSVDGGIDDDTILGGTGLDTIIGGEGSDLIEGGEGGDLVYGGLSPADPDAINIPDATDLRPDNGRDTILGGAGNDTLFGMDDDDVLDGGIGDDLLDGGIDDDTLLGGIGADTLLASDGRDDMLGGDDRDTFMVGSQANGIGDVINGDEGGDDFDTLNLAGAGPFRVNYDPVNGENGTVDFLDGVGNVTGSLIFNNIENVVPCFTPGTMIATPRGEVAVEKLRVGDKVVTRDNGIQEIRWLGAKTLSWRDLQVNPHLKPVLVRQGSLGNGLPERDMMVSPNHRLLVANDRTQLYFDEHEVLVAAKHLLGGRAVHEVDSIGTTYLHLLFDQHEVVLSNGAWTESFQPGDYTLKGMGNAQRNEIYELFPELKTNAGLESYGAARRTLKKHEARLLVK